MSYVTPKTNWTAADGVAYGDMNRIEGNIEELKVGVDSIDKGSNLDIARCYAENVKTIALFQSDETTYVSTHGTQSNDTTNIKIGSQSLKLLENDNIAGFVQSKREAITLDLSIFADGSASATSDYIRFCFDVSDVTKIDTSAGKGVFIWLDQAATYVGGNGLYYSIVTGLVTGWNYIDVPKSSFSTLGTGAWSGIRTLVINWTSLINSQNAYVSFQSIQLVRKDPLSSYPNPFQHKENGVYVRDFSIHSGFWFVGLEFGEIVCRNLNLPLATTGTGSTVSSLVGTKPYTDFIIRQKAITKIAQSCARVGLEFDASNRIYVGMAANILYLIKTVAGVNTFVSRALTVANRDSIEYVLKRVGTTVTLQAIKNNDYSNTNELTIEVAFAIQGYLCVPEATNEIVTIKALSITTIEHADHASKSDWAASVGKGTWEVIESKTLVANAAQVDFLNIPQGYKQLKLLVFCASSTATLRYINLLINSISTSDYNYQTTTATGTNVATVVTTSNTAMTLVDSLSQNGSAFFTSGEINLSNSSTLRKSVRCVYGSNTSANVFKSVTIDGFVSVAAEINKLSLIASADAIASGSQFILMGVK